MVPRSLPLALLATVLATPLAAADGVPLHRVRLHGVLAAQDLPGRRALPVPEIEGERPWAERPAPLSLGTSEAGLGLGGRWGRVELGPTGGAMAALSVGAPTLGLGQVDAPAERAEGYPWFLRSARDSGGGPKAVWFSPHRGGLRAALSLGARGRVAGPRPDPLGLEEEDAAELLEDGFRAVRDHAGDADYRGGLELALAWTGPLAGGELTLSAALARGGDGEALRLRTGWPGALEAATLRYGRLSSRQAGVSFARGPWTLGGALVDDGHGNQPAHIRGRVFNAWEEEWVELDEALPTRRLRGWSLGLSRAGKQGNLAASLASRDLPTGRVTALGAGLERPWGEDATLAADAVAWRKDGQAAGMLLLRITAPF